MPGQKSSINVLWLVSWYPHENNISLGDFIQRQAVAASRYCKVTVVGFFPKNGISVTQTEKKVLNEHLEEIIIFYPDKGTGWVKKIYRTYYILSAALHVYKQTVKTLKTQLIHLHILHPISLIGLLYAVFLRIPLVISEHASVYFRDYKSSVNWLRRYIERLVIKKSDVIIVVSKPLQKAMESFGLSGNYHIVPNVIDSMFFNHPEKIKNKNILFNWIHTSTLAEGIKDIEGILAAVKIMTLTRKDFFVTFLGGTKSLTEKYTIMASGLGITDFVVFHPEKNQKEMVLILQKADAYVNFSKMETFGLSVIEALSAGLPCIATRTGIFDQWIKKHTGILVESGNIPELVDAMITLMDNYESFDLTTIRSQMKIYYAADRVGEKIVALYDEFIINNEES